MPSVPMPAVLPAGAKSRKRSMREAPSSVGRMGRRCRGILGGLFFMLILVLGAYAYYRFDRRILPLALAFAEQQLTTEINQAIYAETQDVLQQRRVSAEDFYIQTPEPDGSGQMLAVNTVLVNDICNAAALAISNRLSNLPPEPVSIPLGMALGLDTLANTGPNFTIDMLAAGNALVNYESKFEAVGINQVHFEVWLKVTSHLEVVNPSQTSDIYVSRDVSLVDTVISGIVPDTLLNVEGP